MKKIHNFKFVSRVGFEPEHLRDKYFRQQIRVKAKSLEFSV